MSEVFHVKLKVRRDMLRAERRCINGPVVSGTGRVAHGPVVQGGKCERCVDVWRRTHTRKAAR